MSHDLDKRLHAALRPIDPGDEFTARVLTRVAADPGVAVRAATAAPAADAVTAHRRFAWLPAALAASILAVVVVRHEQQERRDEGLAARAQVLEALRVTSSKLDLAYQLVNASQATRSDAPPGA